MGLFSKLFGNKNSAMMCCFDIAKPILNMSTQNVTNLAKYKALIKDDEREAIAIVLAMKFDHLYIHIFDRLFTKEYGQHKLLTARDILFQVIVHEFQKDFSNIAGINSFCDKFISNYAAMDLLLSVCEKITPLDITMVRGDNSVISVFSKSICDSIFNSSDATLITDIGLNAMDGFTYVFMTPKMKNTFAKLASFV